MKSHILIILKSKNHIISNEGVFRRRVGQPPSPWWPNIYIGMTSGVAETEVTSVLLRLLGPDYNIFVPSSDWRVESEQAGSWVPRILLLYTN